MCASMDTPRGNPNPQLDELRCPQCLEPLHEISRQQEAAPDRARILACAGCHEEFPILSGIPRLLLEPLRSALLKADDKSAGEDQVIATARSFGYEWNRFSEMRPQWEENFRGYMAPHEPPFFAGKRVLDAGCGTGRHAFYAAKFGARVWGMDLGPAIEVAHRNTHEFPNVRLVQADLNRPPFPPESFDFIYSIGVLHHLPDPETAFRNLLRFLKPGGEIQIYLYWKPEGHALKSALLAFVRAIRHITTRIPHRLLYWLSYPAAWSAYLFFVWPYQIFQRIPPLRRWAESIPMKQYARYPFRVCVNDQFDRFSAPLENRYTREQVEAWLARAGLKDIAVRPFFGWVGSGKKTS